MNARRLSLSPLISPTLILALTLLMGHAPHLPAQELSFTLQSAAAVTTTSTRNYAPNEILGFDPAIGLRRVITQGALALLTGDADGNGIHDDGPTSINALATAPEGSGGFAGYWMSFRTQTTFADGTSVKDGDIIAIGASGTPTIVYSESWLEQITGTSGIDVDALHVDGTGRVFFSFDQDEVTTSLSLGQQNGGVSTLDETTLFRWTPGDSEAVIIFSKPAIVALVNNALGLALSTVVDLTGVTNDPAHPGHLLFTTGSSNNVIEGVIFSTAALGSLASSGGVAQTSTSFGFDELERLGSLAWTPAAIPSLTLSVTEPVPVGPGAISTAMISGATPFGTVYLLAGSAQFPTPPIQALSFAVGSPFFIPLSDPFLAMTIQSPLHQSVAGAGGDAPFSFATPFLPSGLHVVAQAWDATSGTLSWPVTVDI